MTPICSDASSRKLPEPNFRQFSSDLLFFMFYTANQDQWQIEASRELFRRGWRFLISRKIWLGCLNVAQTFRTQVMVTNAFILFNNILQNLQIPMVVMKFFHSPEGKCLTLWILFLTIRVALNDHICVATDFRERTLPVLQPNHLVKGLHRADHFLR